MQIELTTVPWYWLVVVYYLGYFWGRIKGYAVGRKVDNPSWPDESPCYRDPK